MVGDWDFALGTRGVMVPFFMLRAISWFLCAWLLFASKVL